MRPADALVEALLTPILADRGIGMFGVEAISPAPKSRRVSRKAGCARGPRSGSRERRSLAT